MLVSSEKARRGSAAVIPRSTLLLLGDRDTFRSSSENGLTLITTRITVKHRTIGNCIA